jgi:succinate dehydrogenase flavin-adding protein (antitoxin of CptAB toxin-antitoxin module)
MATIKSKHIVFGLVVGFILILFCRIGNDGYSYNHPGATLQGTTPIRPSHITFDSECNYSTTSTRSYNPTNPQRHEILQTTVKGCREETYWGEDHATHEKTKLMSNDEFDRFIEEMEENDADVYWGATY